jgi:hypothetical protein
MKMLGGSTEIWMHRAAGCGAVKSCQGTESETGQGRTCFNYQLIAQFLYSIIAYILHYNPRHVSSNTMLMLRRSNCIVAVSGIATLCKRLFNAPVESGLNLTSSG